MTALRLARESLGWTQERAVAELRRLASERGTELTRHMKTQLSRWENSHVLPGRWYRELLVEAYGRTEEELGLPPLPESLPAVSAEMLANLAAARAAGPATAEVYLSQLNHIRALDGRLGAPATLGQLRALSRRITETLAHIVSPRAREPLASVLADASSLAGWQALDLGDLRQAWRHYETAKSAAREAADKSALVHAMAEQAYVLAEVGANIDAVELARFARESAVRQVPALLLAWLHAVEAEVLASGNETTSAKRALDAADLPSSHDDQLPYIVLDEANMGRWRGNILASLGDPYATEALLTARQTMSSSLTRATASLECDLSRAMLAQGERREAVRHAAQARTLARQSGSVRQLRRVEALPFTG